MSFDFEDDSEIELEAPVQELDDEYGSDGPDFYTDEDFVAHGVDPLAPTKSKPGSEGKVLTLAARYAAGLPLWNQDDCYDHGPNSHGLMV